MAIGAATFIGDPYFDVAVGSLGPPLKAPRRTIQAELQILELGL